MWYLLPTGMGNCGKHNQDSDLIVAISKSLYDRNRGSNCDQVRDADAERLFSRRLYK